MIAITNVKNKIPAVNSWCFDSTRRGNMKCNNNNVEDEIRVPLITSAMLPVPGLPIIGIKNAIACNRI